MIQRVLGNQKRDRHEAGISKRYNAQTVREDYDLCFITTPWLVYFETPFPAPKTYDIIYDTVPDEYALTKKNMSFAGGAEHTRGFEYYKKHCDHIFTISETARKQFLRYFHANPPQVTAFAPPDAEWIF